MGPDSIFYTDPDGDIKGPFTEKQVQEGYRKEFFKDDAKFHFKLDGEKPSSEDNGHTLNQLIDINGYSSPFNIIEKRSELPQILDNLNQKTISLEEKQAHLRKLQERIAAVEAKLEKMLILSPSDNLPNGDTLEGRIDSVETKLKMLSTDVSPWEVQDNTNSLEICAPSIAIDTRKYSNYADLMIEVLDALESEKYGRLNAIAKGMAAAEKEIVSVEQKKEFLDTLMSKLKERDFSYCTHCDILMQSAKHAVFHLIEPEMHGNIKGLNEACSALSSLVMDTTQSWINEEIRIFFDENKRFSTTSPFAPNLVPSQSQITRMADKYIGKVFATVEDKTGASLREVYPRMEKFAPAFKTEYERLLGDKTIRCFSCRHVTGDLVAHYNHLTTYSHLSANDGMSHQDPATFFINYLMKNRD